MIRISHTLILILISISAWGQQVEHLGWQINTEYDEREPILSPDGNTLYFWRRVYPGNTAGMDDHGDIWVSRKLRDGRWAPAQHMTYPLNTQGHDFIWQVSPRHDTLWMTQVPRRRRSPGIAYSTRSRYGGWNPPQPVYVRGLVSRGSCKDYFLTPNRILLLPNEGNDTYGGSDLYVCFPINDTAWSAPINLGPVVNSAGDEDAPYLSKDGKTLFFNSNGHGGSGEHDIFMAKRLDDSWENWSEPENLGEPVNSPGYDFDFRLSPDETYAYWGSETGGEGLGDIFRLNLRSCEVDTYPTGNITLCEGDSIVLSSGFTFYPNTSFQWIKDGYPLPGARSRKITIKRPGTYQLVRTIGNCRDSSTAQVVRFRPVPDVALTAPNDFLCEDDSMMLWAGRGNNFSYQWRKNGLLIPGADRPAYWAKGPGRYQVQVSNGECFFESNEINLKEIPSPQIYLPGDILPTSTASLPKWLWTNRPSYNKGDFWVKDLISADNGDVYVLALRSDGKRVEEFLTKFYSEGPMSFSNSIGKSTDLDDRYMAIDPEGHIIIGRNGGDTYLSKYRSNGRKIWEVDAQIEQLRGVATDGVGNIYTYGKFNGVIVIGGNTFEAAGRGSIFIAKHSPSGLLEWVNHFPVDGNTFQMGNALHVDAQGNAYLAGHYEGIANFRETVLRAPIKGESFFVAKFSPDGALQWAESINKGKGKSSGYDMYTDPAGYSYLLLGDELVSIDRDGSVRNRVYVDYPQSISQARLVAYQDDVYLHFYDNKSRTYQVNIINASGRLIPLWEGAKGEKESQRVPAISTSPEGEIIIAGTSRDDDLPSTVLGYGRSTSVFVSKYAKPEVRAVNKTISLCDVDQQYLLSTEIRGVNYQWIKDGIPISGANSNVLSLVGPGDYQVRILGSSCENISQVQSILEDCDDESGNEDLSSTIVADREIQPEPQPIVPSEPQPIRDPYENDAPELNRLPSGQPNRLDNREVSRQGDIDIRNRTVTLYVWDHEMFDQDTVSLNINGEWVLKDYCLLAEKKAITYTFDETLNHNFIILYANNLGRKPPNTASLMIDDGYRKRTIRLRSTMEDCGMVNIKFR